MPQWLCAQSDYRKSVKYLLLAFPHMAADQSMDQRVLYAATEAIQRLGYSTMMPEQLQVVSGIVSGRDVFAVLPTDFRQEPVLHMPADSVRPGVAGRRDIDSSCCRSFDGYYERSGKCHEASRVLAATSKA